MKNDLRLIFAALLAGLMLALAGCGAAGTAGTDSTAAGAASANTEQPASGEETSTEATEAPAAEPVAQDEPEQGYGVHHAEIEVENYGTISLELDGDTAPITVENFVTLAQSGFYDGLTFHRIMDGFMIQGGDPNHNGTGGSGTNIKGEFAANGVENDISHRKGVISMARATPPDSASSQFFIMVVDYTGLDGMYAAFGHVTEGIEIVEQIAKDARPIDNNGTIPYEEQPVITRVTILD